MALLVCYGSCFPMSRVPFTWRFMGSHYKWSFQSHVMAIGNSCNSSYGVISPNVKAKVVVVVTLRITPRITTHEPPSHRDSRLCFGGCRDLFSLSKESTLDYSKMPPFIKEYTFSGSLKGSVMVH